MATTKSKIKNKGLTNSEALKKLNKFGKNEIKLSKTKNWVLEYLKEFKEIFAIILMFAALLAYLSHEVIDAGIIIGVIFLNSIISFTQKYKADKAVESLQKLVAPTAVVIRDGKTYEIVANLIVPGDIIILQEGMRIPADGEILESSELYVGESILTGESIPVLKNSTEEKIIYMGTEVMSGEGLALITKTGINTKFGEIALLTSKTQKEKSPLEKELDRIGLFVSKVTLVIAFIITILTLLTQSRSFLETLVFSSSVAVAAVPEGLPATVTIALALAVQKLAKKGAIIKQLNSVETLGATTTIVSDKTGTLTKNEMTATKSYSPFLELEITGIGYNNQGKTIIKSDNSSNNAEHILEKIKIINTYCNSAKIDFKEQKIIGDPTEAALLAMSAKIPNKISDLTLLQTIPFNSVRKMMAVLIETKQENLILVKGAPDVVIKKCTHIFDGQNLVKLTSKLQQQILNHQNEMANNALRTIALAYKPNLSNQIEESDLDKLIFVSLIGIIDPPRIEIKKTIQQAAKAGIRLIMCTGDYANTAKAIALQLNLCQPSEQAITGEELKSYTDQKLKNILKNSKNLIFARVNPEDKLRVVKCLKELGEIVAVTGDGVNDAPALKKADIGVAMGITGTEVSKEAANMILSKDNFTNIIDAISEGRTTYNNLKKFIFFIFSCNIGELTVIILALLVGLPAPLTAIMILTINLGTDILPALALGIEKSEKDFMLKPPRKSSDKILEKNFNLRFIGMGTLIGVLGIIVFISFLMDNDYQFRTNLSADSIIYLKATTATFACLVIAQLFNAINAKSEQQMYLQLRGQANLQLAIAILISVLMLISIVHTPILNKIFKTTPLDIGEWSFIIGISSFTFFIEELRKFSFQKLRTKIKY